MSLRDELAGVLARDARYTIEAYAFIFEALELAKNRKRKALARGRQRDRGRAVDPLGRHVTPRELCQGARDLALRQYGLLALMVLGQWGLHSTADLGEVVFNLIESGDLEKTPTDTRADFDHVFDFEDALRRKYVLPVDDVA